MSSKHAAWRSNKDFILAILTFLSSHPLAQKDVLSSKYSGQDNRTLYYSLRYLEQKGYVKKFGTSYKATPKATRHIAESVVWDLVIPKPKTWDKKWHLVVFDIPKDKRKRRDAFRLRIKELGLVLYQNSVWAYPHPLEEEVTKIAQFYFLSGCVSFITAEKLTGEAKLKKHFELK